MENEILVLLNQINDKIDRNSEDIKGLTDDIKGLKGDIKALKEGQQRIENKLDIVYNQTAELTEFRTETKLGIESLQKDIKKLTNVSMTNCFDIADLKAAK